MFLQNERDETHPLLHSNNQNTLLDAFEKAIKEKPHLFSYIKCIPSVDRVIFRDQMIHSLLNNTSQSRAIEIITCGVINMGVWRTIMKRCSKSFKQTYFLCHMCAEKENVNKSLDKYWGGFMTVMESYGPQHASSARTYLLYRHGRLSAVSTLSVIPTSFNIPNIDCENIV